jgi:DNA-binding transcriptional regulator GbsR (MarR family)
MDEKIINIQDKFINSIARTGELMGFSEAMSRIYGLLYISPLPVSLDDICERLSLTKGTVSLYLKHLEERDLIGRAYVKKSRKKYYDIRHDLWHVLREEFRNKAQQKLNITLQAAEKSRKCLEESFEEMDEEKRKDTELIIDRLSTFEEFNLKALKFVKLIGDGG